MSVMYEFGNEIKNLIECQEYILNNIDWKDNFSGISIDPLVIYTASKSLTIKELTSLTIIIKMYIDPIIITLDHTDAYSCNSSYTCDLYNSYTNDSKNIIIQTFLLSAKSKENIKLDSIKTIMEYKCYNVEDFINITSSNNLQTELSIKDISRNIDISLKKINIDDIVKKWNKLAKTGVTGENTQYKTIQFTGLINKNPGYDCIWQLCTPCPIDSNFTFKCHSLQYLWYNCFK